MNSRKRQLVVQSAVSIFLLAALVVATILQWPEIKIGLSKVSIALGVVMTLVQVMALALRAEALGIPLRTGGAQFRRVDLHLASSASFLANCFVPVYVGQLVHISLLQRKTKKTSPMQIIVADSVVFYSEMVLFAIFVLLLLSSLPWGSLPILGFVLLLLVIGLASFILAKKKKFVFWSRPLRVFTDKQASVYFYLLVAAIVFIQPLRYLLLFSAILPQGEVKYSLLAWVGSSVAQVFPTSPGPAIVAGTMATTPLSLPEATLTGLVFEATFILAALLYLLAAQACSIVIQRRGSVFES